MLQSLVILAAILHIKLVSGQTGGVPHTVVVTFELDDGTGDVTVGTEDGTKDVNVDLPQSCNKYVTNIGRAVDMALVRIHIIGDKESKAWRAFSRLNGRLTQMENHLDDLNEQLNHATHDHQRKLCGGDCYDWCRWMPWYCYCCPCCGGSRRRERRNLRQLQVTEDQDLEELEILGEHEVAKQLGRWKKEITCIKRTWDDHKQRWDYSKSVNVEIVPSDGRANDRDAKDFKKRWMHKSEKRRKKAMKIMEMRQKIRETKEKIKEAQEKLQQALEEEQQAEVEAEAAYVDIDDIKEDHTKVAACMEVNEPTTAVNEEPTIEVNEPTMEVKNEPKMVARPMIKGTTGTRPMSSILKNYGSKGPWTPGNQQKQTP